MTVVDPIPIRHNTKQNVMTRPRQVEEEDVGRAALVAKVGTESIWTVDLLFLLQVRGGSPGSVE